MVVDNARSQALLRKLDQLLRETHAQPLAPHHGQKRRAVRTPLPPERVHLIRTTARRLEALPETLGSGADGKERKLRKRLKRLRRKAGGVRDIDVQIAALRKLKIGREQERKARLMQALNEKRSQREQGLAKALADKNVQKVRKALQRWSAGISSTTKPEPAASAAVAREDDAVAAALRMFASLARQVRTLTPENLHAYRTRCKRIRYVAEMAGNVSEAKRIVNQLKRMQDAAGDWHDWQTLTQTAESLFSRALASGLVAALRNVTNAKFVQARGVCQEARRALLAEYRAMLAERRVQRVPAPKRQTEMPLPPAIPSKAAVAAGVSRAEVA
ncbi:MAG: CHAD domain-containing protein [Terriglobales bacterium]